MNGKEGVRRGDGVGTERGEEEGVRWRMGVSGTVRELGNKEVTDKKCQVYYKTSRSITNTHR